jgi:DNA replication protein DnaC
LSIPVRYIRLPDMLNEIAIARSVIGKKPEKLIKLIKQYQKYQLLIIDEWLFYPLDDTNAIDILEAVEKRNLRASTIFCTQKEPSSWRLYLGNIRTVIRKIIIISFVENKNNIFFIFFACHFIIFGYCIVIYFIVKNII